MKCHGHPGHTPIKDFYSTYLLLDDDAWNQFKMTRAGSFLSEDTFSHLSPAYASIKSFNSLIRKTDWYSADIQLKNALQDIIDSVKYFLDEVTFDVMPSGIIDKTKMHIQILLDAHKRRIAKKSTEDSTL